MRTPRRAPVLSLLAGTIAILGFVAVVYVRGPAATTAVAKLSEAETAELGITVQPHTGTAVVDRDRALQRAREDWNPPDPDVRLDPFLFVVTAADRERSSDPIHNRAVWIVRYTGFSMTSPGGVPISRAYSYFDANTGEYLGTSFLR